MKYLISYIQTDSSGEKTLNTFELESDTVINQFDDILLKTAKRHHASNIFRSGLASIFIESVTLI